MSVLHQSSIEEPDPLSLLQRYSVSVSSSPNPNQTYNHHQPHHSSRRRAATTSSPTKIHHYSNQTLLSLASASSSSSALLHRHLSLDQQTTIEHSPPSTIRASSSTSRPTRHSPISFLHQSHLQNKTRSQSQSRLQSHLQSQPQSPSPLPSPSHSQSQPLPHSQTQTSTSTWSLNPPNNFSAFNPDLVRHTTKLLKSRDSRTGRLIINQYMKGKEIGRGVHGIVYIGKNMDKIINLPSPTVNKKRSGDELGIQSSPTTSFKHDHDYETVAIKVVRREPRGPKSLRRSQMQREREREASSSKAQLSPLIEAGPTQLLRDVDDKLKKEIAIMKRLRHRHIVQLKEVIDDAKSKKVFMILEFMEGGQVIWQDEITQTPLMTVEQVRRTFRQVLLGLEYLHYQGIIHRDIKPANLLWTADRETVKISDFGVSHLSGVLKRSGSSSNLSSIMNQYQQQHQTSSDGARTTTSLDDQALRKTEGSPAFMAPELCCPVEATPTATPPEVNAVDYFTQCVTTLTSSTTPERTQFARANSGNSHTRVLLDGIPPYRVISHPLAPNTFAKGERPGVGKGIDIWALGVTLFCLLFGRTPFKAPNEYELFNVIWREAVVIPEWAGTERQSLMIDWDHPNHDGPFERDSRELIDLLGKLLTKDPRKRITLEEVKTHPWVLSNLDNTQEWVHETAPVGGDAVHVTNEEVANFSHPRRSDERVQEKPLGGVKQSLRKAAIKLGLQRSTGARDSRTKSISSASASASASACTSPVDRRQLPFQTFAELTLAGHTTTNNCNNHNNNHNQLYNSQSNSNMPHYHPPILASTIASRSVEFGARPSSPLSSPVNHHSSPNNSNVFKRGFHLRGGRTGTPTNPSHNPPSGIEAHDDDIEKLMSNNNRARSKTGPPARSSLGLLKGSAGGCNEEHDGSSSMRSSRRGVSPADFNQTSTEIESNASSPRNSLAACSCSTSGTNNVAIYAQHPHMLTRPVTGMVPNEEADRGKDRAIQRRSLPTSPGPSLLQGLMKSSKGSLKRVVAGTSGPCAKPTMTSTIVTTSSAPNHQDHLEISSKEEEGVKLENARPVKFREALLSRVRQRFKRSKSWVRGNEAESSTATPPPTPSNHHHPNHIDEISSDTVLQTDAEAENEEEEDEGVDGQEEPEMYHDGKKWNYSIRRPPLLNLPTDGSGGGCITSSGTDEEEDDSSSDDDESDGNGNGIGHGRNDSNTFTSTQALHIEIGGGRRRGFSRSEGG